MYFVTGNTNKFAEARKVFPTLKHFDLSTDEPQTTDLAAITHAKIAQAREHLDEPFFCEDVSLHLDMLNGLPGPFIKFFVQNLSSEELGELFVGSKAQAVCTMGYFDGQETHIITGTVDGVIVKPRGGSWGFNCLLEVDGVNKTLAELHAEGNMEHTHRTKALKKLKELL